MDILISLLIFVVIAVVLLWLLHQLPITEPYRKILIVVVVALLLLVFLVRYVAPYLKA